MIRVILFLFTGIACLALAACGSSSTASPTVGTTPVSTPPSTIKPAPTPVITGSVAAIVNGHEAPISAFRTYLLLLMRSTQGPSARPTASLVDQAMNESIDDQLVANFAAAHHLSVSSGEVDKQQAKDVAQAGGIATFGGRVQAAGLTVAQYRELVYHNLLAAKVQQYLFPVHAKPQPYAHVEHILISTHPTGKPARTDAQAKSLAESILSKVKHGANFAALAKQYSDDPGSGPKGGDLGKLQPGATVPPFNHAIFTAPVNTPVLVQSQFGYHVIVVLARGIGPPQVSQQDQQRQHSQFITWITTQQKQAKIVRVAKVK